MGLLDQKLFEPDSKEYTNESDYEVTPQNLFVESDTGVKRHAWLFRSPHQAKGLVVQAHGNAENLTSHACYASWLTAHGMDVLCWDYRGYGKSTGVPSKQGVVNDATSILKFSQSLLRGSLKILLGQSMGAGIALNALSQVPDFEPSLGVLDGAFANYRSLVKHRIQNQFGNKLLGIAVSHLFSGNLNAEDAIDIVRCPLVSIHSQADTIIPIQEHQRLFARAVTNQKTFWESQTQKHLDTFRDDSSPFRKQLAEYLKEKIFL